MAALKYIYSDQGQQESTILQTEFLNDIFSLFGSWQSEKTGDELAQVIYASRNDIAREVDL